MNTIRSWMKYLEIADEREEIETNRITRRAFFAMTFLVIFLAIYLMMLSQVAEAHNLDLAPYQFFSQITIALCVIVIVCCAYTTWTQAKQGIMGYPRFVNSEKFPVDYLLKFDLVFSGVFALVVWAFRDIAEVSLVGFDQVYWVGNLAVGMLFALGVFACVILVFYVVYKEAKKQQAQIMKDLDN